jgi:hypothetical protein
VRVARFEGMAAGARTCCDFGLGAAGRQVRQREFAKPRVDIDALCESLDRQCDYWKRHVRYKYIERGGQGCPTFLTLRKMSVVSLRRQNSITVAASRCGASCVSFEQLSPP